MVNPTTSDGITSGVNWMRLYERLVARESATANEVLPTPGTSSIRTCPPASMASIKSRTLLFLPRMTRPTCSQTARARRRYSSWCASLYSAWVPIVVSISLLPPFDEQFLLDFLLNFAGKPQRRFCRECVYLRAGREILNRVWSGWMPNKNRRTCQSNASNSLILYRITGRFREEFAFFLQNHSMLSL